MKEIWDKNKLLIIGVAIILVVLLLFVFGGWIAGTIGTIFGSGAGKKLQDYVAQEKIEQDKLAQIEEQKRADLAAYAAQEMNRKAEQEAKARADQVEIKARIDQTKTKADLDREIDREAQALQQYLDKEGGFARASILLALILASILLFALCIPLPGFSAPASMPVPTQAEIARAERVITLLRRARRALEDQKAKHALELLRTDIEHKARENRLKVQLDSCNKQKSILAAPTTCPPTWRPALITGLVVAGVCGVAWGSVELGRTIGGGR